MSFAPSALAWNIKYAGSPGYVTWSGSPAIDPVIAMGYNGPGSSDFTLHRLPTISMPSAGTYWQYATVTLWVYYYCPPGRWCLYKQDTKYTLVTRYGATATVNSPIVEIPTTGTYYWTSIIQIVWYNSSRQWVAWENFYPDNTSTTYFDYCAACDDPAGYQWVGNADMAINRYGTNRGSGWPWGPAVGYNLNTPTGYIYCLQGLKNN